MKNIFLFFVFFSVTILSFSQGCSIVYEVYDDSSIMSQTVYYSDTSILITNSGKNSSNSKKILLKEKSIHYSFESNDSLFTKYNYTYTESFKIYNLISERIINDGAIYSSETKNLRRKLRNYKKINTQIIFTEQEKTILSYKCKHAIIKTEDNFFDIWYSDELVAIDNKTANICSLYSSIRGVILEEYISGRLYKKAVSIQLD